MHGPHAGPLAQGPALRGLCARRPLAHHDLCLRSSSTQGLRAPLVLDGPINGPAFRAWVEQFLVPELGPSRIVVMDNLSAHKVAGIQAAIEQAGATVKYLPPYSPDLNPIEQVFAKLKAMLRTTQARTVDALWSTIGELLERFGSAECERYIRHCGYCGSG